MTLLAPNPDLKVSVVVPARNEEGLIGACLEALSIQKDISPGEYEVILVLDACTDGTGTRAREVAEAHPGLRLHFLDGPGKGAGQARRLGMEAACARLLSLGRPEGLIASTDADTVVAPDWLAAQLRCAGRGARAIGGRIRLAEENGLAEGVSHWHSKQGYARHLDLLADLDPDPAGAAEHWQFSGASLALTAAVYEQIGGLEPRAALEDEHLERVLRQRNIDIHRPLTVRVTTSARLVGRATRGLARDLALASWTEHNTYAARNFGPGTLLSQKRPTTSVVVPATTASQGLRDLLSGTLSHKRSSLVDEVILACNGFEMENLPPGVTAFNAANLMPDFGAIRGWGDLLWRGLSAATGEIVIFLDPDVSGSGIGSISGLLGPLVERPKLQMVKGYRRPPGQLTEFVARPFLNLHAPELAGFFDPLATEFAARRSFLQSLLFPVGAGARISFLLDAARKGVDGLAQVDLGSWQGAPNPETGEASYAILAAAASRLPGGEKLEELVPGPLFLPNPEGLTTRRVPVEERPPLKLCRPSMVG